MPTKIKVAVTVSDLFAVENAAPAAAAAAAATTAAAVVAAAAARGAIIGAKI